LRSAWSAGKMRCRIDSTSRICAKRVVFWSPSRRAMLVTKPRAMASSADRICFQSRRTMSSTASAAKAWVVRAYSVTNMMFRPLLGTQPTTAGRSITGITWPRRLTTPSTCCGAPAMAVTVGMATISRILKTLMPNSSERSVPAALPRRNSSISNLLEPVRLVRSSMSFWAAVGINFPRSDGAAPSPLPF